MRPPSGYNAVFLAGQQQDDSRTELHAEGFEPNAGVPEVKREDKAVQSG